MSALRACLLALAAGTAVAWGQTRLDPEVVTRLAVAGNLGFARRGRSSPRRRPGLAPPAGSPNPELGLEVAGGQDFEGRVEVGLTQWFPVTSRLRWERTVSQLEITKARLEVADMERRIAVAA